MINSLLDYKYDYVHKRTPQKILTDINIGNEALSFVFPSK